jgi:hypothetical protein
LIAANDIALRTAGWPVAPAQSPALVAAPVASRWDSVLRGTLFITILLSCIALIEPSPHDGMMVVLLGIALLARVPFKRLLVPLLALLLLFNIGGLLSLTNVPDNSRAIIFTAVSLYLAIAALLFAALLSENTLARMNTIRSAYIAAAVITAIAGTIGYFNAIPSFYEMLTLYGRATGFFKDPNVYGPFLIWPLLILIARVVVERFTLRDIILQGVIAIGLLLSFSRGAWMHFLLSGAVLVALLFITAQAPRLRVRLIGFSAMGAFVFAALFVVMISIPQVRDALAERANLFNTYDVGETGRFGLQEIALGALLHYPLGMGVFEFGRLYGLQQHNVYLQAFIVYGWIGGVAYLLLIGTTLLIGMRSALTATPWQIYAIVSFAVFVGQVAEGAVIDTDHWRHFFLTLGMIWGMAAATRDYKRTTLAPGSAPA